MKHRFISSIIIAVALCAGLSSCDDEKSYAELLTDESHYVNAFLADQRVINEIPADTVFESGPNAPFYRLDEDGYLYMQVINPGTKGNRVKNDELIYFRFTRWNLRLYKDGILADGSGNETDMELENASFRYDNYVLPSSSQWGSGIQVPLHYLPVDCEVNIVVKSQYGMTTEIAQVIPFLYRLRYYRPKV